VKNHGINSTSSRWSK